MKVFRNLIGVVSEEEHDWQPQLAVADEPVGVNGSILKVTSAWLGGPDGHWDTTLYETAPGEP